MCKTLCQERQGVFFFNYIKEEQAIVRKTQHRIIALCSLKRNEWS